VSIIPLEAASPLRQIAAVAGPGTGAGGTARAAAISGAGPGTDCYNQRFTMAPLTAVPARATDRTIGLLFDARSAYDVKVLRGVAAYLGEHGHLTVMLDGEAARRRTALETSGVDGVIADLNHPAMSRLAGASRVPVVGVGGIAAPLTARVPSFRANNAQIGDLAADHLLAAGMASFAFCGYSDRASAPWSHERERAFASRVAGRGFPAAILHLPSEPDDLDASMDDLEAWLRTLPKPVGIMAAHDALGRRLLQACRVLRLVVPDEVAVVGVDNDDLQCHLCHPALSSVEQGAVRLGYSAALLLDRILGGAAVDARPHLVSPVSVIARRSSAATVDDPEVARALRFIADHLAEPIDAADVAADSPLSRRALEQRFRARLRTSIAGSIRSTRLGRVRDLIARTDIPLKQIAALGGFLSVQHMTTAFARAYGETPAHYRRGIAERDSPR
jgi:LacI family transcriptional regulator